MNNHPRINGNRPVSGWHGYTNVTGASRMRLVPRNTLLISRQSEPNNGPLPLRGTGNPKIPNLGCAVERLLGEMQECGIPCRALVVEGISCWLPTYSAVTAITDYGLRLA